MPNIKEEKLQIEEIHDSMLDHFGGDLQKVNTWFKTKQASFGGVSPIEMITEGKTEKVYKFIKKVKKEK